MPAIQRDTVRWIILNHQKSREDHESLVHRQVEEPSSPQPPMSPTSEGRCSGWACLTEAQQAGILICIAVFFAALVFGLWFFLRSKKKEEWVDGGFVLVRRRRRQRARSRTASITSQRSRFFFRHEGLTGTQQPHSLMVAPLSLHIPPPPPPPVAVSVPVPMPIPVPFPISQQIYPVSYQPYYRHSIQGQAVGQCHGNITAPVFAVNHQNQPPAQPPFQPQPPPNHPWTQAQSHRHPQKPPRRRPSFARRLFKTFSFPVGRASTIASSSSQSSHAPSVRISQRSRASKTSVSTPPSSEVQSRRNIREKPQRGPNEVSSVAATVYSDDYVLPTNHQYGSSIHKKIKTAAAVRKPLTTNTDARKLQGTIKSTPSLSEEQGHVEPVISRAHLVTAMKSQGLSKNEACKSSQNINLGHR